MASPCGRRRCHRGPRPGPGHGAALADRFVPSWREKGWPAVHPTPASEDIVIERVEVHRPVAHRLGAERHDDETDLGPYPEFATGISDPLRNESGTQLLLQCHFLINN